MIRSRRGAAILLLIGLAAAAAPAIAQSSDAEALVERAGASYALGAFDEAEALLREALRLDPGNARAARLMAEIRVERERGRTPQGEAGPTAAPPPRLPPPAPRPPPLETRTWSRPGASGGLRAIVVERHADRVVLRLQVPDGTVPSRAQTVERPPMFVVHFTGVADNLPTGPLVVGAAGLRQVRHAVVSRDPPTVSVVLDLEDADVPVDLTAGGGEIVVTVGAHPPERAALEGAAYRPPVQGTWRLAAAGGDGQAVRAGEGLAEPLAIRVTDAAGRPVSRAEVTFTSPDASIVFPDAADGSSGQASVSTNAEGLATVAARSAGPAGAKVVRASVVAPDGSRSEWTFQVAVRPGPPATILKVAGDGQDVRVRHLVAEPLTVAVQDAHGNPVPGVPVRFEYVEGNGWLRAAYDSPVEPEVATDARGLAAWAHVRAGPYPGAHRVAASFVSGGVTRTAVFDVRAVPVLVSFDWKDFDLIEAIRAIAAAAGWNITISDEVMRMYERGGGQKIYGGDGPHPGRAELEQWYRGQVTARFEDVSADVALDHILAGKPFARIEAGDGTIRIALLSEAMAHGGEWIDGDAIPANLPEEAIRSATYKMPPTFAASLADLTAFTQFLDALIGADPARRAALDFVGGRIHLTTKVRHLRKVAEVLAEMRDGREVRVFPVRGIAPDQASQIVTGIFGKIVAPVAGDARAIVVTADRETLRKVDDLLKAVDRPRVRVYHLRHYPPSRFIRDILPNAIFGATVQTVQTQQLQTQGDLFSRAFAVVTGVTQVSTPRFTAYPIDATGQIIVEAAQGDEKVHDEIAAVIDIFDTESALALLHGAIEPRVYEVHRADAAALLRWIRSNRVLGAAEWSLLRSDGSILIWAAPGTHQVVESVIRAFDREDFSFDAALVYHLKAGDVAQVAQALQALYAGVSVVQMPLQRLLVVIGGGPEVARTLEELDVPTEQGTFMRVYELRHMRPSDLDRLIGQTVADDRQEQRTTFDWSTFTWRTVTRPVSSVRRIPYDSLGKILVQATQELHGQVVALIQAFDTPGTPNLTRLEYRAFEVRQADVASLAQIMRQTILTPDDWVVVDEEGRRLLVWASPTSMAKLDDEFWATFDKPEFRFGKYRIVPITYGQTFLFFGTAFDIAATIEQVFPDVNAQNVQLAGRYYVVLQGPEDRMEQAAQLIAQIDQPAMRVYKMKHIPPSAFVKVINRVIFQEGGVRDIYDLWFIFFGGTQTRERFRALPIDADSTLIVVAQPDEPEVLAEIDAAYNALDVPSALSILTGEGEPRTYELRHAKVRDVLDWIRIYNVIGAGDYAIPLSDTRFVLWASPGVHAVLATALPRLDYEEFDYERWRVIRPRYADLDDVRAAIQAAYQDVNVTPIADQRAILVMGAKDRLDAVQGLVDSLDRDGFVVEVYTFRNAPTPGLGSVEGSGITGGTFEENIRALVPPGGGFTTWNVRGLNHALIYGVRADVDRFLEVLRKVDETWGRGWHYEIISVRHRAAQEVRQQLDLLFRGHNLEFVPVGEINSFMLIAPPDSRWNEIKAAIDAFDTVVPARVVRVGGEDEGDALALVLAGPFADLQVARIGRTGFIVRGAAHRLDAFEEIARSVNAGQWKVVSVRLRWSPNQGILGRAGSGITTEGRSLEEIITEILVSGGGVYQNVGVNSFEIWGVPEEVDRAVEVLRTIDEAWKEENNFEIVKLKHRSAAEIRDAANNLLFGSFFDFVPLPPPMNAIMLVGVVGPEGRWEYYRRLIDELDTAIPTRVLRIENQPQAMLQLLRTAFPDVQAVTLDPTGPDREGNFLLLRGMPDRLEAAAALIREFDQPRIRVYRLQHIPPSQFLRIFETVNYSLDRPATPRYVARAFDDARILAVATHRGEVDIYSEIDRAIEIFDTPSAYTLLHPNIVVRTYHLRHADEQEAVDWLRRQGIVPRGAWLYVRPGNSIVVWATPGDQAVIAQALASIDSPDFSYRFYGTFTFRYLDAEGGASLLRGLYPSLRIEPMQPSPMGAGASAGMGARTILLVGDSDVVNRAVKTAAEIDVAAPAGGGGDLIVFREISAASIEPLLRSFYPAVTMDVLAEANAIAVVAPPAVVEEMRARARSFDQARHTAIRPLKYYNPSIRVDVSPTVGAPTLINNTFDDIGTFRATVQQYLTPNQGIIEYDPQSNAFIITDGLERVMKALEVIDRLDRPPPQFLIEAVLAEVNLDEADAMGVAWRLRPGLRGSLNVQDPATIQFIPAEPSVLGTTQAPGEATGNFSIAFIGGPGGTGPNLEMTVRAVLSGRDFRIVTAPKLVTRNNVEAAINVGEERPQVTPGAITAGGFQGPPTITPVECPRLLRVRPTTVEGSDIARLAVFVDIRTCEDRDFGTGSNQTRTVLRQGRTVATTVDVPDGYTLVLGGFINEVENVSEEKVPFLGDVPGLGALFRSRSKTSGRRELLIFINPRILTPDNTVLAMENELGNYRYLVNFPADWTGRRFAAVREARRAGGRAPGPISAALATPPVEAARAVPTTYPAPATKVDVNWATSAELAAIPGMPEHIARLIVLDRERSGPFASVADLKRVPGVDDDLFRKIEPYLKVDRIPAARPTAAGAPRPAPAPGPAPTPAPAPAPAPAARKVDLNAASAADLAAVPGLDDFRARMIVAYRTSQGPFASVDDLARVPGMTPEALAEARPHLYVEGGVVARPPAEAPAPVGRPAAVAPGLVDINTATADELARVLGLEESHARMIVAYREMYGPFRSVDGLKDVPGITPEVFARIRDRIAVAMAPAAGAAKVDINTATADELARVLGLEEFHARMIVAYRGTYGPFRSVDDLKNVPGITPEVFARIRDRIAVAMAPAAGAAKVDLNTATETDLASLPGLDSYYAKLIVAYRSYYGPFARVEDVLKVPGVTEEMLARFRDRVTAGGGS